MRLSCWLISGLLCALPVSGSARHLSFEQVGASVPANQGRFALGDLDGDGCDEVLTTGREMSGAAHGYLFVWDQDHLALKQQFSQGRRWDWIFPAVADVAGDRRPEISFLVGDSEIIEVRLYGLTPSFDGVAFKDTLRLPRSAVGGVLSDRGPFPWDVSAWVLGRPPATPEDSPVFIGLCAGFSKQPRGVLAMESRGSHRILWQRRIGPGVNQCAPVWRATLDSARIVLTGAACGNGSMESGISDTTAVIAVVDGRGRLVWRRRVGGNGADPVSVLTDLDGDGRREIVVACCQQADEVGASTRLIALNLDEGTVLRNLNTGGSVTGLVADDLDRDGWPEIVLAFEDGRLSLYDSEFRLLREAQIPIDRASVPRTADIDADGVPEIYVRQEGGRAYGVFDGDIERIGSVRVGEATLGSLEFMTLSRRQRLVAVSAGDHLVLLRPVWGEPPAAPAAPSAASPLALVGGGVIGGLLLAATLVGGRRLLRGARNDANARALVQELRIIRHGARVEGRSEEPLVRLRRGLNTCSNETGLTLGREILEGAGQDYAAYVSPTLRRVVRLSAFTAPLTLTLPLAAAARGMNRSVKRVLRSVDGDSAGVPDACAAAVRRLARLEALLRRLDRFALSRSAVDPYQEASATCAGLRERMAQARVRFDGIEVHAEVGARVFIEPGRLGQCLRDMLANSIEACEDAAEPHVGLKIVCGERSVVVQVIDNGRGIPRERWEAVFHGDSGGGDPRSPRGLGLSQARRVVETHAGKIVVRESVPWDRTIVEIELCRAPS